MKSLVQQGVNEVGPQPVFNCSGHVQFHLTEKKISLKYYIPVCNAPFGTRALVQTDKDTTHHTGTGCFQQMFCASD